MIYNYFWFGADFIIRIEKLERKWNENYAHILTIKLGDGNYI